MQVVVSGIYLSYSWISLYYLSVLDSFSIFSFIVAIGMLAGIVLDVPLGFEEIPPDEPAESAPDEVLEQDVAQEIPPWLEPASPGATDTIISWLGDKEFQGMTEPDEEIPNWMRGTGPLDGSVLEETPPPDSMPSEVPEDELEGLPDDLVEAIDNQVYNRGVLSDLIAQPLAVARKYNLQLHLGEWGCYEPSPTEDRLRWYADVRSICEENNIAWTTWDYKGGFGVVSDGEPVQNLIDTLLK